MTDKQIIIDGVDVAKCRNLTSEWDFNNCGHICKGTECKYKRLWYKKQLKRKEQALDEIEEFVNRTCDACKEFTPDRQSDINCRYCNWKQILNIIKSTKNYKGGINEEVRQNRSSEHVI